MRSHRSQGIKLAVLLLVFSSLISLTTLPSASAANGGSPVVTVIYTDLATSPTSDVPGFPGANFVLFDRVFGSPNGNWAITAATDLPTAEDEVLVVNDVVRAREGTTFSPLTVTITTLDTKLGINDAGEVVYAVNSSGDVAIDEFILSHDGVTNTIVAQEGDPTGLPTLPGTTWGAILETPAITSDGTVGFSADTVIGVPTTQDDMLILGSTVLAQEGVTVPTGQLGTETWENFNIDDFFVSADGTQWIGQGDLTGATATDGIVAVNGAVVIQEGVILPGSGFPDTVNMTNVTPHMTAGGQWYVRGSNNVSNHDWVYGNGAVIAQRGAPIYTGATEIFTDTAYSPTFFLNVGNGVGDYVIGGVSNELTTSDGILVYNNTSVIARENDPIDIDGNGTYDDNAFFNTFGNDDGHLTNDGIFYFVATIRDVGGVVIGDGFFSVDLSGGGTPTPTSTASATPQGPTPTPTPTSTSVPSTSTPTATATNTTVPSTSTPTATPESGNRVCSTVPIVVPDNIPAGATGTVNVALAGNITDLNVILTGTHTWVGDLAANISNGSTNVTFYDRPGVPASTFGCNGDNLPGVFGDDEGADGSFENSCQAATPAYTPGGHYTNNNPLSAFDGQPAAGTWTLTVSDNAGGDTGSITGWCVEFETGTGPTPTPTTQPQVPDINVAPGSFNETHSSPPQVTTDTLNIQNVGSGTLNWTIAEDDSRPWNNPNPIQPRDVNAPVERLGVPTGGGNPKVESGPIVGDGSFEAGTPNPEWEEFSSNFGTPLCDAVCGTGGGTGPRTGAWWAWFGGTTAAETGILTQTVTIPSGSAELTFWLEIPATATGTNGFLSVRMDGTELFLAEETTAGYGTYAEVSVDVSTYADGGNHELVFFSTTDAGAAVTNFFIDDVAITVTAGGACSAPTDIPWLSLSPTNGSTAGGSSTPVTLTYNSATLAQGTYTGTLCIESNDPDEELVTVPVTLNIGPPTAIDLGTFTAPVAGFNLGDLAAAGLLLLAGALLIFRRK